ncbi:putative amidohydrolase [Sphingosinicella soli]|uniref:Putative amidohydrolase n=1 Tax=Sphingosinicella soli TaxID=333708 RepID=A0A7W7B120_9SPHN|nr:carbon-nitrogen hydrolase family protein [Sphingosinicella soli]MBB4632052.1 putative amidohydrolase [Sphingosinicella soli]
MTIRIAIAQMTSGTAPAANAAVLADHVAAAAADGAAMLFTPEMSGMLDRNTARLFANARSEDEDVALAAVRKAAREAGIWVALGSLALRDARYPDRLVNRSLVIDDTGEIRARYDKMHLFDVEAAPGEYYRESASFVAGVGVSLAETPVGTLGLAICYDVRFPRLFDALSGAGAVVIALPAAFTRPTGRAHWHTLLRARAIETASFVIAAAQTGEHEDGRSTYGHSLVIDPWGDILLDADEAPGLHFAEIDLSRAEDVRRRIPVLQHRRDIAAP